MTYGNYFSGGVGLLGAFLSWYLGVLDGTVKLLVVMAVLDQVSGLLKASVLRKWSSEAGFHGIAKKVFMFMLVGIANVIDKEMLGGTDVLRDAVSLFYIANEGISIIENAIESGAPVPEGFKEWFISWRNKKLISHNVPGDSED
ncbi:MAG: phage holin family protein [Synergistaceae bacterium]|nr:phage holin family protein [Synergistaceae bacterium]